MTASGTGIGKERVRSSRLSAELYMDSGNWIRFRIEQMEFVDVGPIKKSEKGETVFKKAPFTIYASAQESGLGLIEWWDQ
jgi:DNA-directed RNA polymerase subunit E'/Rpb7